MLITDARCYSTTDIFAAGFQDHEIQISGTGDNTGAGGANVWTLELIRQFFGSGGMPPPLQSLPKGRACGSRSAAPCGSEPRPARSSRTLACGPRRAPARADTVSAVPT